MDKLLPLKKSFEHPLELLELTKVLGVVGHNMDCRCDGCKKYWLLLQGRQIARKHGVSGHSFACTCTNCKLYWHELEQVISKPEPKKKPEPDPEYDIPF